jgi:hypothetical protein
VLVVVGSFEHYTDFSLVSSVTRLSLVVWVS